MESNTEGYSKSTTKDSHKSNIKGTVTSINLEGQEGIIKKIMAMLTVGRRETNIGPMVIKKIKPEKSESFPALRLDQIVQKYNFLKSKGLPVPEIFRVNTAENEILMNDLTADGSRIIDKHTPRDVIQLAAINNRAQLEEQAIEIAKKAYSDGNGVFLSSDAYSLVLHPDGNASVYLLDIGMSSHMIHNHETKAVMFPFNEKAAVSQAEHFIQNCIFPLGKES